MARVRKSMFGILGTEQPVSGSDLENHHVQTVLSCDIQGNSCRAWIEADVAKGEEVHRVMIPTS
jgi:hypothetical protein